MSCVSLIEALDQALSCVVQGYSPSLSAGWFPDHGVVLPPLLEMGAQLYSLADEYDLIASSMLTPIDWSVVLQTTSVTVPSILLHPKEQ